MTNKEKEEEQNGNVDSNTDKKAENQERDKKGRFGKKPPKKQSDSVGSSNNSSSDQELMKELADDLYESVKERFGDIDLSHLDVQSRLRTMRSMLKSKQINKEESNKKDINKEGENPTTPEWKPIPSFAEEKKANINKVSGFYNKKSGIGADIWNQMNKS